MKTLLLTLIVLLLLSLSACGGEEEATFTPAKLDLPAPTEVPASTEAPAPTEAPEPTDVPKATDTAAPTDTPAPTSTPQPTNTAAPTDTPAPTATPEPTQTPTPEPVGLSPSNPIPAGELVVAPGWEFQVLERVRGDEAWNRVLAANQFNDPPAEGAEYLMVRLRVKCLAEDEETHWVDESYFEVVGSDRVQRYNPSVVDPDPALDAELYGEGETEGWITLSVGQDEDNLILVFEEWLSFDDESLRYVALEEGAALDVPAELFDIPATDSGVERSNPVPFGETSTTENWQLQAVDVVRGDDAWNRILEANSFNDPPEEGMEYVMALVNVRYIGTENKAINIDGSFFSSTGDANVLYDAPSVVDPDPEMDIYLFPGGQYQGWVTLQAEEGETGLKLIFEPWLSFTDEEKRFLALE
jgi:hypothetical protein